jgi:hypothetical protein
MTERTPERVEEYHRHYDEGSLVRKCPGCGATWDGEVRVHTEDCDYVAWLDEDVE